MPRDKADHILAAIRELNKGYAVSSASMEAEIEAIRAKNRLKIAAYNKAVDEYEKDLKSLVKKTRKELFSGADQVTLDNGVLLFTSGIKVRIPRNALETIEKEGWTEAVRIAKTINRPVIEAWPDDKLAKIGATKKKVEEFNYELK